MQLPEVDGSLTGAAAPGKFPAGTRACPHRPGLTGVDATFKILQLMSAELPEILDAWRMVAARREFKGSVALASLPRLRDALTDAEGDVSFVLGFDSDTMQVPHLELRIEAELPLQCQRSLQRFLFPVLIEQRLGLIRDEEDEAALPEGYEPLLVAADGALRPLDLVEDELILALPLIPVKPGSEAVERDWPVSAEEEVRANPFAGLAALKKKE